MATTLEELQQQLIQGAQAQGQLTGLDERAVRANALRDRVIPTVNQYGAASPFQQLDAAFGRYQGKRDMKAIDAERATARDQMAGAKNALPMYNAQQAENALKLAAASRLEDQGIAREQELYERNKPIVVSQNSQLLTADGKLVRAAATDEVDPFALVADQSGLGRILRSDDLEAATGMFDPRRWAGAAGYDLSDVGIGEDTGQGDRIKALQLDMSGARINQVKTNLEGLGVNPTDKDLQVAFADIPTANDQPAVWALWSRDQYLPLLEKAARLAVASGRKTPEEAQAMVAAARADIAYAVNKYVDGGTPAATPNSGTPAATPNSGFSIKRLS